MAQHSADPLFSDHGATRDASIQVNAQSRSEILVTQFVAQPSRPSVTVPPSIHFTLDLAGTILAVNPQSASSLGYTVSDLLGRSVMSLFLRSDEACLQSALDACRLEPDQAQQAILHLAAPNYRFVVQQVTVQVLQGSAPIPIVLLTCENAQLHVVQEPTFLDRAIQQQAKWEKLLQVIAQAARQSFELTFVLSTAVNEVRQILHTDRVLIYRSHTRTTGSILVESVAATCEALQTHPDANRAFQQFCIQWQNGAAVIPSGLDQFTCDQLYVQAEAMIPVMLQDELWGFLAVHHCHGDRLWEPWELNLLQQLATHLESVIQQAELYREVRRLNSTLERQIQAQTAELQLAFEFEETLKRITDNVRDSLDEKQILETAVKELVQAVGISCCNAALYNLETGVSTVHYEYTTDLFPYQGRSVSLDAFPEIYCQLLQEQAFQFCSLVPNPVRGRVSMLACPIFDNKGVLGDLWLINQSYYGFTKQDIRLVQQVANQCAIALRQARLYQAAQAQVEELERLSRLKDDFLSTVSHELRTPMANIKMSIQMLTVALKQAGALEEQGTKAIQYLKILQSECQREISLINNLLDLSRLDSDLQPLNLVQINLASWLPVVAQPFLDRIQEHQQQLEIQVAANLPAYTTDLSHLERIVNELLQNACKYTPARETIAISAQLVPSEPTSGEANATTAAPNPPLFCLCVSNTGIEIPAEELPRVFDKFYRIPNHDPWQHGGTGLGLALVKKLAERLQGQIKVESTAGRTSFLLLLPLQP
ncbi:MAG TPA: GAF domain-containing protein [Trichocoleus sp.]